MRALLAILLTLFTVQGFASNWQESTEITGLFNQAGVTGTFVLYDASTGDFTGHDQERSKVRFVPASTFKIPNSLIGLSVGAVKSVDEILPYGGQEQPFDVWEKDMGLREAIAVSNVPIYQALARRIGLERMQASVAELGYGNADIGASVDTFWLEGPLTISAQEQAVFLANLAQGTLPISDDIQKSVRDIVLLEQGEKWQLYGKTGWQNAPESGVGWWVGWVTKDDHIYAFALNLDIKTAADAKKRVELGKASLKALGVL
ncbi:class D beta-lactamase [Neptuniibacter sp. CAU 1671]|uniref:class D beta-lactamase n=1 Tax=Neptuniibacter sp. CAU 1671 TaxID=3032593 RepID=UPI0023DA53BA|nr:class D beta-lactamase [Neptuniibacter sp. CAU 1671]MDF2183097.1 class D beta-lactamase [Neptuniibacter sp. CAU 1671]